MAKAIETKQVDSMATKPEITTQDASPTNTTNVDTHTRRRTKEKSRKSLMFGDTLPLYQHQTVIGRNKEFPITIGDMIIHLILKLVALVPCGIC